MRTKPRPILPFAALLTLAAACTPPFAPSGGAERPPGAPSASATTLILVPRGELPSLSSLPLFVLGGSTRAQLRVFNAGLTLADGAGQRRPYLAETIPQLGTESWTVFSDGRMETVYRLRANAVWHDGAPLRASDFVFAWRLMTDPEVGLAGLPPQRLMEEVNAPDDVTVRIRWSQPFPDAGRIDADSRGLIFPPLPQHLLEGSYQQGPGALRNQLFWTVEYVGAGPYKLDRWDQGSFIEARAFDRHVLGHPKIERLKLLFINDASAALAHLLVGEAHVPIDASIRMAEGLVLKEHWSAQGTGVVEFLPGAPRWVAAQHRPEYANPPAILDLRVRRALAHSVNKPAMNEALLGNLGVLTDTFVMPTKPYFPIVERAITRYPYGPSRTEQLMSEAGYPKDREGVYAQPGSGRLNFELLVGPGAEGERERSLLAASWRESGFQVEEGLSPRGAGQEEANNTFRSMVSSGGLVGLDALSRFTSSTIPRAQNRWVGENQGGWSNADYDSAAVGVQSALDPDERIRHLADAARAMSEQLGVIFIYFSPEVFARPSNLQGISISQSEQTLTWNIHEWEFR